MVMISTFFECFSILFFEDLSVLFLDHCKLLPSLAVVSDAIESGQKLRESFWSHGISF